MKHKILASLVLLLLFFIIASSGCLDFPIDGSTTYQAHPTKLRYDITYGYVINCTGMGSYEIHYYCDKPSVLLSGTVSQPTLLYPQNYSTIRDGSIVLWNISDSGVNNYTLGITATVHSESFLVADLNGEEAGTIQEITTLSPDLVEQYCHEQTAENETYLDLYHVGIQDTAQSVYHQTQSDNAFAVAKALFIWLKENTQYQIHADETGVQPARLTYQRKTGDCDDLSFLYISLCRSLGIPARFIRGILITDTNGNPSAGPHAWAEVFVGGDIGNNGWIPVECASSSVNTKTEIHQNFGVEDAFHLRLFVDDGSNESLRLSMTSVSTWSSNSDIAAHSFVDLANYAIVETKQLVVTKDDMRSYQ